MQLQVRKMSLIALIMHDLRVSIEQTLPPPLPLDPREMRRRLFSVLRELGSAQFTPCRTANGSKSSVIEPDPFQDVELDAST